MTFRAVRFSIDLSHSAVADLLAKKPLGCAGAARPRRREVKMARKAVITGVADTAVGKLDLARAASGGRYAKMTWCRLADACSLDRPMYTMLLSPTRRASR